MFIPVTLWPRLVRKRVVRFRRWNYIGQTSTIYRGQLAVDMYDSAKHDLVWRGVASKTLDPKAKPEKRQKNLNKAVAKLMKNYPPPAKK